MNPPPCSEKVDTQETASCVSKGTTGDRRAAGLEDSAQQLCSIARLMGMLGTQRSPRQQQGGGGQDSTWQAHPACPPERGGGGREQSQH